VTPPSQWMLISLPWLANSWSLYLPSASPTHLIIPMRITVFGSPRRFSAPLHNRYPICTQCHPASRHCVKKSTETGPDSGPYNALPLQPLNVMVLTKTQIMRQSPFQYKYGIPWKLTAQKIPRKTPKNRIEEYPSGFLVYAFYVYSDH